MTTIQIEGGQLHASAAERTVSGLLVPYGEVGNTNLGRVIVEPGVLTYPPDVSHLAVNQEHRREDPRGSFLSITDTPAGLYASMRIAATPEGDTLLAGWADPSADVPRAISMEAHDVVIKGGKIQSGRIYGAAIVKRGAYPSAQLFAADADADEPEAPEATDGALSPDDLGRVDIDVTEYPIDIKVTGPSEGDADAFVIYTPTETNIDPTEEGTTLTASARTARQPFARQTPGVPEEAGRSFAAMTSLLASSRSGNRESLTALAEELDNGSQLFAAFTDIKSGTNSGAVNAWQLPQWVDELWTGKAFERRIVPLFNHADLTALEVKGWAWDVKPTMGKWAGDKAAVPSGPVKTKAANTTAQRIAGGHDIARELYDFPNPAFWDGYYRAMTESYALLSDTDVFERIYRGATYVKNGAVPAGVSAGMTKIVDGALSFVDLALPSFAVVAKDVYREILLTKQDDTLAYLSASLGLEEGTVQSFKIVTHGSVPAGGVLVGSSSSATVYELGGGTPIRTEALDQARGGIDPALFGYIATLIHDPRALTYVNDADLPARTAA
jgi:hypothetical protein